MDWHRFTLIEYGLLMMLSDEMRNRILESTSKFSDRRSAVLEALYAVQEEHGHVTEEGMEEVARILDVPKSDVAGVATFYTLFFKRPVGKYVLQVCTTLSCSLLGAEHLVDYLSNKLGIEVGETTTDGLFTLLTTQCLGDCGNAPVMMVGDTYYDNLTIEKLDALLEKLKDGA